MRSTGRPDSPYDFADLDFDRLWAGRGRTTAVERRVIAELLDRGDNRRVLEIGPGGGRISTLLLGRTMDYVGVDVTPRFLPRLKAHWPEQGIWIAGDLARLPIAAGSVTGAVVIRVYNFLVEPVGALRELNRVLASGGRVVLSYFPVPSVATVWDDLRNSVRTGGPGPEGRRPNRPASAQLPTRAGFRATVAAAGFEVEGEAAVGFEDFRAFRWLPEGVFVGISHSFARTPLPPHRFVLLRKPGTPPASLLPLDQVLVCPRCREPLGPPDGAVLSNGRCPRCDRRWDGTDGVLDLRPRPGDFDAAPDPGI